MNSIRLLVYTAVIFSINVVTSWALAATPVIPVDFEGASLTAGVGATLPLELRVKSQLAATMGLAKKTKTLVALDYFYVTNFSALENSATTKEAFETKVRAKLLQWLKQNDRVVVGLLPVRSDLSQEAQNYLKRGGKAFAGSYQYLEDCCLTRAKEFNAILRAVSNEQARLEILDVGEIVERYAKDSSLRPKPSEMYADFVHLNDKGQAVLYNLAIKPVLETIWFVPLFNINAAKVSKEKSDSTWKTFALNAEDFRNRKPGLYKGILKNEGLRSGTLYRGQQPDQDQNLNRLRTLNSILAFRSSGEEQIIPVKVRSDGAIVLDLVKALFFTSIPLEFNAQQKQYRAFGYDYWQMAYNLFGPFTNPLAYFNSGSVGKAVGTNYDFIITDENKTDSSLSLFWRIYPLVEKPGFKQPLLKERQPVLLQQSAKSILENGGERSQAHLTYKTQIVIGN